ncbi:hypothetical protein D3C84_483120 [compost metagenome]
MFNDDPFTQYIISLHETGLQINEMKKEYNYVPIEWYIQLLEKSIKTMEMYRDEVESNRKFSCEMGSILGIKPK